MIMLRRQEKAENTGGQDSEDGRRASTKHAVQDEKACPGMIRRQEKAEIMEGKMVIMFAVQVPSMPCKLKRHARHDQKARKG
ncbi:MAG: hypothetical protein LBT59_09575 [Clostridiales bacterium]|jgi:hypothetical protein|nr:hypothetical protein [Clostridiales bacterium]